MKKTTKLLLGFIIVVVVVVGINFLISKTPAEISPVENQQDSVSTKVETESSSEIIYKSYVNQDFNIELKYPENYELQEGVMGVVAAFLSETKDSSDLFRENLNVIIQDLSTQPMTLEEYTNLSLDQIGVYITDSKIITSEETSLDGNPAHKVIYTGGQDQFDLKWMQIWTIVDDTAYILSYTAEANQFDNYFRIFNEMMNSFEVLN